MNTDKCIDYIRYHGLVLESAVGADPSLAQFIAGEPIKGNWWGHPKGHEIYELTQHARQSKVVLVCTLALGRITLIHRRLWPHFIRLADRFPPHSLDQVNEIHQPSGRHNRQNIRLCEWAPKELLTAAGLISVAEAADTIKVWLGTYGH